MRLLLVAVLVILAWPAWADEEAGVEMLMKRYDNAGESDSTSWKCGDIIRIKPIGHSGWARRTDPANLENFVCIRVPGLSMEDAAKYVEPVYADSADGGQMIRLRRYRADWAALPESIYVALALTGYYTATVEQVETYMKDMTEEEQ